MTGLGDASSSAGSTRGLWHATTATLTLVALFRLGVATAGALVPGYAHRDDVLHGHGVRGYQVFTVLAMAALAAGSTRSARWPRWLGAVSLPLAIASTAFLLRTGGEGVGSREAPNSLP